MVWLLVVVAFLGALAGGGWLYLRSIGIWSDSDPHGRARLRVPRGADASTIGRLLEAEGVVDSAVGFRLAVWLQGGGEDIQAGTYALPRGLTAVPSVPSDVIALLTWAWLTASRALSSRMPLSNDARLSRDRP